MIRMSDKVYDALSKLQRWLPALAVFYMALCSIWGFGYGQEVRDTILAVAALLAATLEISSNNYHAQNVADIMYSLAYDEDEADEDEPSEPSEAEAE